MPNPKTPWGRDSDAYEWPVLFEKEKKALLDLGYMNTLCIYA